MAKHRDIVVGLDIGTYKTAAIVADLSGETPLIIGVGSARGDGMRRGVVVDIEGTARSVVAAVEAASRMSGEEISAVTLSISGSHVNSLNNRGVVAITQPDHEITIDDVARCLDAARVISLTPDREILHILPREYEVDGNDGVRDPVGMVGGRLEVEAHMVTIAKAPLANLERGVRRAGLYVHEAVLAGLASSNAVLTPAEKELGVVVCDIGGGTTDLAIFDRGSLWYTAVLPLGGEHITNDIAVGLRAPLPLAEQIKLSFGLAKVADSDEHASFDLPNPSGRGSRQVPQKVLASIIEPRVQELLQLVAREIKRSGYSGMLPGGVVFTGGTANLPGLVDLAADLLDLPARVGYPTGFGGMSDIVADPAYATAVGLVQWAARFHEREAAATREPGQGLNSFYSRIKTWLNDLF